MTNAADDKMEQSDNLENAGQNDDVVPSVETAEATFAQEATADCIKEESDAIDSATAEKTGFGKEVIEDCAKEESDAIDSATAEKASFAQEATADCIKEESDAIDSVTIERTNFVQEKDIDFDVILKRKWLSRFCKRTFDICSSFLGLIILLPFFVIFAIMVATTSKGGVFFKQERIGRNGKPFKIIKFRTMTKNAESVGMQITVGQDMRITKVGKFLRATKIDELPQLFNVLFGQMSFVGARPEVPKYVAMYSDYEKNILKIRPGITELSSIVYRDEASALAEAECPEYMYVNEIMTKKLEYNLDYIEKLGLCYDIKLIFKTLIAIVKD